MVIDGLCRDTDTLARLSIPVFARGATPKAAPSQGVPEVHVPITIGGVEVNPGDLVIGDDDGIVVGTDVEMGAAIDAAERIHAAEANILAALADGIPLFDKLNFEEHVARRREGQQSGTDLSDVTGASSGRPDVARLGLEFAHRMERVGPSAIRELLILGADPEIMSFGGGYPDPALFPMHDLRRSSPNCWCPSTSSRCSTPPPTGCPSCARRSPSADPDGMPCTADDVLIIQGGQQGLDLTAKLLIDPGDVIVTEKPTFLGALIAFTPTEPAVRRGAHRRRRHGHLRPRGGPGGHPSAKIVYTVPDFQNPTG